MRILLVVLFFAQISLGIFGQDVRFFLEEMNNDPRMDTVFNARIDSIWQASQSDLIDSTNYLQAVNTLQGFYDQKVNVITGDKAELFSYFILLKHQDYPSVISRFEGQLANYNRRTFTTINEIYRRSYIQHHESNIKGYKDRLESFMWTVETKDFRDFMTTIRDLQFGEKAPSFSVRGVDNTVYNLDSLRGKVVILDFWATWCAPCVKEIPAIKALYGQYADREDVLFLSISLDTKLEALEHFIDRENLEWPQVMDAGSVTGASRHSGEMATLYKAKGIPKYILIDKEGYIRYNSHLKNYEFLPEHILKRYL